MLGTARLALGKMAESASPAAASEPRRTVRYPSQQLSDRRRAKSRVNIGEAYAPWTQVTIDLELHLSKRTKFKASGGPYAHYDVYLYRAPKTKPQISNGPYAKAVNSPSGAKDRVLRWEDDMYPPSPPCSVCSPASTRSLPVTEIDEFQPSSPWTLSPYSS